MTLRAAVIGCGRTGSSFADDPLLDGDVYTHAEAYVRCAATKLVAVCDRDADKAQACAERWGVAEYFSDAAEMLGSAAPDLVSICTPDASHAKLARLALNTPSVRALLCEKPLATQLTDGEALIALARDRQATLAVAHVRRYAANIQALRQLIAEGAIGRVQAVTGWYGKGVAHNGTHWFDLLRMLAGEVVWVEAADRLGHGGDDPTLDVTMGLCDGAVATLRGSDSNAFSLFEMDLVGAKGRILLREGGHRAELFRAVPSRRYSGYTELLRDEATTGDMRNMMLRAVENLADSLTSGRPPLCTGEDGLAALRIADAAARAAVSGRRTEISPVLPALN